VPENDDFVPRPTYVTAEEEDDAMRLRQTMWDDVGLVRSESSMNHALGVLDEIMHKKPVSLMMHNMIDAARIITQAALERKESRGGHYRTDYPEHAEHSEHHPFVYTGNGPWY
jgi:L-aspartate oxidase